MKTKMRKISELKHLEITIEDIEAMETNINSWAKSKFNKEESVNGLCTYYCRIADDEEAVDEEYVLIVSDNGSYFLMQNVAEIGDPTNGYRELLSKTGERLLFAGALIALPFDLKEDLDKIYNSPLEIQNVSEDLLSKYLMAFKFIGRTSLNEKILKLENNDDDKSVDNLMAKMEQTFKLQQDYIKYQQICNSLDAKFAKTEINNEIEESEKVEIQPQSPQPTTASLEELQSTLQKFMTTPTVSTKALDNNLIAELEESASLLYELTLVKKTIISYNQHFPTKSTETLGISDFDISAYSKRANKLNENFSIFCAVNSQEESQESFNEYLQVLQAINKTKNANGLTEERKAKIISIATETKQDVIENSKTKQ